MKYWIIVDDHHDGPYSARQLAEAGITPQTLVWHEGMADWAPASTVEELMQAVDDVNRERREAAQAAQASQAIQATQAEPQMSQPQYSGEYEQPTRSQYENQRGEQEPIPDMPSAPIAWSIIVTLLCCTPIGIVGIVFASMTKSAYYRGEYAKSKR